MCGIAGVAGNSIDRGLVPKMLKIMRHRGPDSQGFFIADHVHIGHCRLAINDLSDHAVQPFVSKDNKIAVAINGEIYNYGALKKELQGKGHVFQSDSDSEVVLHAYLERKLDFISELNGMFAISIWDGNSRLIYLVRDRLGIKPLYYSAVNKSFLFASEIKALALFQDIDFSIDMQSLAEYLAFENYFSNRTLSRSVRLVEPGEIVRFDAERNSVDRRYFWKPNMNTSFDPDKNDVYGKYEELIESSVDRHLMGDVSLGCYLSSGIDSSSVTYWAAKKLGPGLKTFTGSFGIRGFYDESTDASKIAELIGCINYKVEIKPEDFVDNIENILWHLDEPRVGMGSFSQYMVAWKAAQEVKVILTGHGGDEFFAGYPVFKAIYGQDNILKLLLNSSMRELPFIFYFSLFSKIKKEIKYFLPNIFPIKSFSNILNKDFCNVLMKESNAFAELEALKNTCSDEHGHLILTYLKLYLPALFNVEDKISMAFSLESRTPLCDNELLEFALSVPLSAKLKGYELKHIPKTAMRYKLPSFVFGLPKRGFPTPLRYWFTNELKGYVRDFICDNMSSTNIFNREAVEKVIHSYQTSTIPTPFDEIIAHRIWIIFNLIVYFRNIGTRYVT